LTVALDATYSTGRHLSGVGVYSREILHALAALAPEHRFLWCYRPHRFREGLASPKPPNASFRPLFERRQWFRPALFHGLNQRLPASRFPRTICTFHDLFVMTGDYSTPEFRARFTAQARAAAGRADLIACVSAFTAGQVRDVLGVEPARLRVVPHGVRFPETAPQRSPEPVILHVGAIQRRKNLVLLIAAFERAVPPPWQLVLAGSDGFGAREVHDRIAASSARDRIQVTGWIDDRRLAGLYARASVFAFPSLDEGFGIPVLEAMAQGVPVLCSGRAALAEVCGDAAMLAGAFEEDAWADALARLTADESLRDSYSARGRAHARAFSWRQAADRTWKLYLELLT
jgi:glycosyltransferase involved in cell wall biosynthesis